MGPQKRRAVAMARNGPLGDDLADLSQTYNPRHALGQLRDKYGHPHSEAIFKNWTPAAIRALGIHRVGDEPEGGAA
jgi:hypothetical protein